MFTVFCILYFRLVFTANDRTSPQRGMRDGLSAVFSILYFILRILLHMITAERDEGWVERLTQFPRHPPTPNLQPGGDSGVDIYHPVDHHHR